MSTEGLIGFPRQSSDPLIEDWRGYHGDRTDTGSLTAALADLAGTGLPLSGRVRNGRVYEIDGNLQLPSGGIIIEDLRLKQMSPSVAGRRTITKTSGTGPITLRRVKVDRNSAITDGTISDSAGIWIANIDDILLEDVEVTGDGPGKGIFISDCARPKVIRAYIHDMTWGASSDPGSEQIVGLWFNNCTNWQAIDTRIEYLLANITWGAGQVIDVAHGLKYRSYNGNSYISASTGTTGASPPTHTAGTVSDGGVSWTYLGPVSKTTLRAYNTDGLDASGCNGGRARGGVIRYVWEGSDVSGSVGNRNIWMSDIAYEDCDAHGWKCANVLKDGGAINCTALRCGLAGFAVGGVSGADSISLIDCVALDTGSSGIWSAFNVAGFYVVGSNPSAALNVHMAHCRSEDRQLVATTKYGVRNEPASPTNLTLSDFRSAGHTIAPTVGVSSGMFEMLSDGSVKITGDLNVTGTLTFSGSGGLDYDEGIWTPTVTCSTTPPTGVTYDSQVGYYTKIGRVIIAGFSIDLAGVGSGGVGNVRIDGLPFPAKAGVTGSAFSSGAGWENLTITGRTSVKYNPVAGTTQLEVNVYGTGTATTSVYADLQSNTRLGGAVIYIV